MNRRGLITGLISFVAAPAVLRVAPIMPVKVEMTKIICGGGRFDLDGNYLSWREEKWVPLHEARSVMADVQRMFNEDRGENRFFVVSRDFAEALRNA